MNTITNSGDDNVFYVYPYDPKIKQFDYSKAVRSKYLIENGLTVVDPVQGGSSRVNLYRTLKSDGTIDKASQFQNTNNYLIVPANYDPSEASAYAASVNADIRSHSVLGLPTGLSAGIADMKRSFSPGGSQDLQRGREWGVPKGEVEPAFKDSTSWNLGFTVAQTMIPDVFAEIGGGILNIHEYREDPKEHKPPTFPFGLDKADAQNFPAGVEAAQRAAGHGLGTIYKDMLTIGHWLHDSIAPVKGPPGRSYGPRRPANHADNDESTTPGFATPGSTHTHYYMAAGAAAPVDTVVSLAALSSFHQIGYEALKMGAIGTPARSGATAGHCRFSALQVLAGNFDQIAQTLARYHRDFSGFVGPDSPVAGMYENATRLSPLMEGAALPSIAPVGKRARDNISTEQFTSHHFDSAAPAERKYSAPIAGAEKKIDQLALRGALEDLLERQGRLPPSGASAFDPLLTPAWPGLQLPA